MKVSNRSPRWTFAITHLH